jgi:hypothetical protein
MDGFLAHDLSRYILIGDSVSLPNDIIFTHCILDFLRGYRTFLPSALASTPELTLTG